MYFSGVLLDIQKVIRPILKTIGLNLQEIITKIHIVPSLDQHPEAVIYIQILAGTF